MLSEGPDRAALALCEVDILMLVDGEDPSVAVLAVSEARAVVVLALGSAGCSVLPASTPSGMVSVFPKLRGVEPAWAAVDDSGVELTRFKRCVELSLL